MSGDVIIAHGRIAKAHGELFDCVITIAGAEHRVIAKRNGKLTMRKVHLVAGDDVTLEIPKCDPTRGRIISRGRKGKE